MTQGNPPRTSARLVALLALAVAFAAAPLPAQMLTQDRGATGAWQAIARLRTTASVLHTTAHPDDEDGGLLAWLSRGRGVRVGLLTLNRGEGGDNALGPELFDALGLVRTEELRVAGRYYGLDRQYFTDVVDYGFSKRLDEALSKWGHEDLLRDVVRVIRTHRPFVIISRFQGDARDGHGNHQAAGLITKEGFEAAGDPARFPEMTAEGLRPWKPLKLYTGTGWTGGMGATLAVDVGEYSPWLGESYQNFARIGLSYQRSQNSGTLRLAPGPSFARYNRVGVAAVVRETSFFEGIDTTIPGLFRTVGEPEPEGMAALLGTIDREVKVAIAAFRLDDPSACVPALTRGLKATREAIGGCDSAPEAAFVLKVKERQFQDAINVALGIEFTATARPAESTEPSGPFAAFMPAPVMGPVVPGQTFQVKASLTNHGGVEIVPVTVSLRSEPLWKIEGGEGGATLKSNQTDARTFTVHVPADAQPSRPYFARRSIAAERYTLVDHKHRHAPATPPPLTATVRYAVDGVPVEVMEPVYRREANSPYGSDLRALEVVPAVAITVSPRYAVVPLGASEPSFAVAVELLHNRGEGQGGVLTLELPRGWTSEPSEHAFAPASAGEKATYRFRIKAPGLEDREYTINAVATVGDRTYREGYETLRHRDLSPQYLYRPAVVQARGVDVKIAPGMTVGYVMGVGDEVPAALEQLGVKVRLLGEADLAGGDLGRFDAVITGTRAYGVREDLKTHNGRLLDYVKAGGNLIVLYNTPEFDPAKFAPFPARLPGNAEEVSEEDAAVAILHPRNPVFTRPNAITNADFRGWVEQRGSKFFASWDGAYTPMLSTHDQGQSPQKGGWLMARHGKGHYTYCAYAFHRQLPFGVPGAFRLMANLLSLGKSDPPPD